MTKLEQYYNKFHEEHRLETRHGFVEFNTSMKFIHEAIERVSSGTGATSASAPYQASKTSHTASALSHTASALSHPETSSPSQIKILDIGAGTGRYSIALSREGFDVTAVELVKHNLEILRAKHENVKTWQGDARDLHFLDDDTFDLTLVFGPMYHLHGQEEKIKALCEAKRVTKNGGIILVAYVMNEYSVISYCFKEHKWAEVAQKGGLSADFHITATEDDLYDYVRISDIDRLNKAAGLLRIKIISADGAADFMRRELNEMSEEEFKAFCDFQLTICERADLVGAGSHTVDILRVEK